MRSKKPKPSLDIRNRKNGFQPLIWRNSHVSRTGRGHRNLRQLNKRDE